MFRIHGKGFLQNITTTVTDENLIDCIFSLRRTTDKDIRYDLFINRIICEELPSKHMTCIMFIVIEPCIYLSRYANTEAKYIQRLSICCYSKI